MDKGNIHKPPSRSTVYLTSAAIAVALFLLLASVYLVRPQILEDVEGRLLDARFQLRGAVETSGLVTLVAVDEKSLEAYGRWPWSREVLAALIERLSEMGAGAIGLDIVFSEAQPSPLESLLATRPAIDAAERERLRRLLGGESPDAVLAEAIRRSGRVVNGHFFYTSAETARELEPLPPELEAELLARSGVDAVRAVSDAFPARDAVAVRMNIPELARAGNGAGFFNFVPGRDGIVRSASLLLRYRDEFYPSLALKTLALYLERAPIVVHAREYGIDHLTLGGIAIPTDEVGGFVLNYRGPPGTIPGHSAADILQGRVPAEAIAGKLVLLGVSAIGVYDAHSTPFGPSFPGVEIQANVAENILLGDYIHHSGMELLVDLLAIFLILFLLAMVLPLLRGIFPRFLFSIVVILAFAALDIVLFEQRQLWLNLTYPLLAWVLGYIALNVYLTIVVERRLSTVNTAFQYYLHPELVKQLTLQPELLQFGGEKKRLTILFSDIRNFTNLSENLTPDQLAHFIHCYMDPMTEQVLNHRGTLDKYIGDAVMAIFGAPLPVAEHPLDACNAALDMIAELDTIVHCCPELAHVFPIRIGVGVHTGDVVVGNLGSSFHFTYTALGDNVNLASRLEGLTKAYGVSVIISEDTRAEVGERFLCRELDRVRVKGKQVPIRIYELIARMEEASEEQRHHGFLWEEALAQFRTQQWAAAKEGFEALLRERGEEKACSLYIERCEHYAQHPPPAGWDGVTTFTSK
jgi:adenylate cyclase